MMFHKAFAVFMFQKSLQIFRLKQTVGGIIIASYCVIRVGYDPQLIITFSFTRFGGNNTKPYVNNSMIFILSL